MFTYFYNYTSVICLWLMASSIFAQTRVSLIYGDIQLKNGKTYTGHIRWNESGEATWDDIFNGSKYDLPIQTSLSKEEARNISSSNAGFRFDFMALWQDDKPEVNFSFKCNFGDIVSIDLKNREIAVVKLKNGQKIRLKTSASADLGAKKMIYEKSLGTLTLQWRDIQSIHFRPAPKDSKVFNGRPIYGEITTTAGIFKGYVSWDQDECLARDIISGYDKGVKVDLYFRDIREIKAENGGSMILLTSGKSIFLNNHDDVGKNNHGILIRDLAYGKVLIEWEKFISARFMPSPVGALSYDDFPPGRPITGTVFLKSGEKYHGRLIYDQDENLDIEFLDGENDGFTYYIPFREIDKIIPQNYKYSLIILRNGEQKMLGDHPDVTNTNNGVIVSSPNRSSQLIAWKDIKEIDIDEME